MPAQTTEQILKSQTDINQTLISWKSPSHPFKKRSSMFFQTVAAITFMLIVIVFFLHEWILIGVILSVTFVAYVLSTVPPMEVEHIIKPIGLENAGRLYQWLELSSFWIEKKWDYKVMVIQTRLKFPPQIRIVLNNDSERKVREIVGKYLVFHEKPQKGLGDKISDWLVNKIPLESAS
jgi:hypothetical protein